MKKKKFPKKAKLISSGGFYIIIPLKQFVAKLDIPIIRKIKINQPELDHIESLYFSLEFIFERVYRGYAEYRQVNEIKLEPPLSTNQ